MIKFVVMYLILQMTHVRGSGFLALCRNKHFSLGFEHCWMLGEKCALKGTDGSSSVA